MRTEKSRFAGKTLLGIVLLAGALALQGCSYVSDYVESKITNRASFSITAELSGSNVIIRWDETDYSGNFAGYEIYVTESPNDEYAGYRIIAGRWAGIESAPCYKDDANLEYSSTRSHSHDKNLITGNLGGVGIYFFRVGIIHWDDNVEDRTAENGYIGYWDSVTNYNNKTNIDAISGYARLYLP